ncbi:hypothetical protein PACILC2_22230 [Paenibacillus cisolokensis]|uniref:Uncharacterized protein n=1 Tax=Paenibacillus cisolokensis TaxID=1658519 RepID=A0ABQ4N650_9BACL|nr:hypothetical protein [Paenibacillus cisolokensis]GIQ63655.1 hypothetical protein PACILC2_22230 [Paenibacillus cisolokensis]
MIRLSTHDNIRITNDEVSQYNEIFPEIFYEDYSDISRQIERDGALKAVRLA